MHWRKGLKLIPEHHSIQHNGEILSEHASQTLMKNEISTIVASHLHSEPLLVGTLIFFVLIYKPCIALPISFHHREGTGQCKIEKN